VIPITPVPQHEIRTAVTNPARDSALESANDAADRDLGITRHHVNMIRHDAVSKDRMISMQSECFLYDEFGDFGIDQPTSTISRADRDGNHVTIPVIDRVRKMVFSSPRHAVIVHP